jgi:hypothetical protein
MGAMTIAFVGLTLLALALILVPRIQRSRRARVRRPRRVVMATAGAPPASTAWRRPATTRAAVATPVDELEDEWDDELGWGDPPADEPPSGRVWSGEGEVPARQDGAADDTITSADAPTGASARRETAPAHEVVASDDGGRHGVGARNEIVAAHEIVARRNGARHEVGAGEDVAARDRLGAGPADAQAPLELEDDDWQFAPPPRRAAGSVAAASAAGPGRAYASAPARPRRGPLGSPVFLLALYSTGGLALVVLAVSLLSGSLSGGPSAAEPAVTAEPVATVEAAATPTPEPTVSSAELERRRDAATAAMGAATAAAERAQRQARAAERRRIARERRARERARARAEARRRAAASPPAPTTPVPPAPTATPPSSGGTGGGGGGSSCEFCIG